MAKFFMKDRNDSGQGSDSGHIRPHTKGTSNEISFSVLDAMRHATQASAAPTTPDWVFSDDEVKTRKKTRKRGRRLKTAAIIAVAAVVVAGVATFAASGFRLHFGNIDNLRTAITQVQQQCAALDPFENLASAALTQPLSDVDLQAIENMLAQKDALQSASANLSQIKASVEGLQPSIFGADLEASNQAISAINTEQNLVKLGTDVLERAKVARTAYGSAESAMQLMLSADSMARESAALMETGTRQGAQQSIVKSNECIAEFNRAKEALQAVQAYAPVKDAMQPFLQYVELRTQAQEFAIESTQGLLDHSRDAMTSANDKYNSLETQASALISQNEEYPPQIVSAAYDADRAANAEQWSAEAARAAVAITAVDDFLR